MSNGGTPSTGPSPEHIYSVLNTLVKESGLAWDVPMSEALVRAGFVHGFTSARWAHYRWYGPLEPLLSMRGVSDIFINGPQREVFAVLDGAMRATGMRIHETWIEWLQTQIALRSKRVHEDSPQEWRAPNGEPTHVLEGTAERQLRFLLTRSFASPDGPSIAIRILPKQWMGIEELIAKNVLTKEAAHLLVTAVKSGVTILIGGQTGSGKTTLSAALLLEVASSNHRIVTIEESIELPQLENSVSLEVGQSGLSFSDLVRASLRMKPSCIVVGEVRGAEASALLSSAVTGHPGIATIHATDVQTALGNLAGMAVDGGMTGERVRSIMTSTAAPIIVCYMETRRLRHIAEVVELGAAGGIGDRFPLNHLFGFDEGTQTLKRLPGRVHRAWAGGKL